MSWSYYVPCVNSYIETDESGELRNDKICFIFVLASEIKHFISLAEIYVVLHYDVIGSDNQNLEKNAIEYVDLVAITYTIIQVPYLNKVTTTSSKIGHL